VSNRIESTIYPVTPQDRMNYYLGLASADPQIAVVLNFPQKLDTLMLERSFQVSLKFVPILNCRFVEAEPPYWESLGDSRGKVICSVEECTEADICRRVKEYLVESFDPMTGPMIRAKLFRAEEDRLCVKVSHLCSDGAGLKEYMALLASVYTHLSKGADFDVIEAELLANRQPGFRDQAPLFSAAGISDIKSILHGEVKDSALWSFPSNPATNDIPRIAIRQLDRGETDHLIRRAREYGATVNDLLCTAYFRALGDPTVFMEPCNVGKAAIGITVDLRRYLPGRTTGTICNLSAIEELVIEWKEGRPFEAVLARVKAAMDTIKGNQPGLTAAALVEQIGEAPFFTTREAILQHQASAGNTQTVLPLLTNLGIIKDGCFQFGDTEAEEGYMTPPINYAPTFCVAVSTYNGALTLSSGFHTPAVSEEEVNHLLDVMAKELKSEA
jgi:NRPS condensation-like uncharacterized protein